MKNKKKLILGAIANVSADICAMARQGGAGREGMYARGLASEGYNGGYVDALNDVILMMNGIRPDRNHWWED